MYTIHLHLYQTRDLSDQEFLELEIDVPEEMYCTVLDGTLKKFDFGPFGPEQKMYIFHSVDLSEDVPAIQLVPIAH